MSITIQLQKFEGPLALLLYLIRKEEMDIFDIKINEITQQYLEYIKLMKELDLEVAGEFVALAATLIHIKSRMLLPQYDENGEVIAAEDPRKELVQRLLEYQKYQEASKQLYERPLLGRDIWSRGSREKLEAKEDEIVLEDNALFALISAYRQAARSIKKRVHQVKAKAQSIAQRILEIRDKLVVGTRTSLSELLTPLTERMERQRQTLITFISLLELGKLGFVNLYQSDVYQEIYTETKKPVETDAVSRVEEYDSMKAEDIAAAMMTKASQITEQDLEAEASPEEFVLRDGNDEALDENFADAESTGTSDSTAMEMASDEDILAAEKELEQNHFEPESNA
jgi:segregation and condensation protein A